MTTKKLNKIKLLYKVRVFHLKDQFTISRGSKKLIKVIDIILKDGKCFGYGECIPYDRYNEKLTNILKYLKKNKTTLITKINEEKIETIPYFSLQNAISAALTDLNCKINNTSFLQKHKIPSKFTTAMTVPIFNLEKTKTVLQKLAKVKILKIKLNENEVFEKLQLIKSICKKSKVIVDANEGWTKSFLQKNIRQLEKYNIAMIEQPFPRGKDYLLKDIKTSIPFCADETFHTNNKNLHKQMKYYDYINLKLDKFGTKNNITKILSKIKSKKIMLGCMVSSSLSLYPALQYLKIADYIDLDGASFLKQDRDNGLSYKDGTVTINSNFAWGKKKGL